MPLCALSQEESAMATLEGIFDDGELPLAEDARRAAEAWLVHLAHERGAAGNTLSAYERDLRQFLAWLKGELGHAPCLADLARLDAKRFRAFMAARRRAGCAEPVAGAHHVGAARLLPLAGGAGDRPQPQPAAGRHAQGAARHPQAADGGEGRGRDGRRRRRPSSTGSWRATRPCCCCSTARACASPRRWGCCARTRRSHGRDVLRITGKGGKERLVPVLPGHAGGRSPATSRFAPTRSPRTARCSSAPRAAA